MESKKEKKAKAKETKET